MVARARATKPPSRVSAGRDARVTEAGRYRVFRGLAQRSLKENVMNRLEKVLYTAKAHTTGGRAGMSRSSDGRLEVRLSQIGRAHV